MRSPGEWVCMTKLQLQKSRKALLSFDSDVPGSMVSKKLEAYF